MLAGFNVSVIFWSIRGVWRVQWIEEGRKKYKYFRTEQEAKSFDSERIAKDIDDERLTLGELAIRYFQFNPDIHEKTKRNIVYFFAGHEDKSGKHIQGIGEFLRDKYAESLSRKDLEQMRQSFRSKATSNATINRYQAYIHAILSWGVEQELITINPWRDFKKLKVHHYIVTATVEDLRRVYIQLPAYLQWAVKTAFFLALRPGIVELFSLLWTSFDWRRGLVYVRQGKSGRIKTVIPPPVYMQEARIRYEEDMKNGIPLVCHRQGKKVLSYKEAWQYACKRANVKMRPYDIRHIAATEMLARGADLAAVAAQLGHSNVATTGSTYAHVTPGGQAKAAALMPGLEKE